MKTVFVDRSRIHSLLRLAWPVMIEEALATVVQYIDAAMVGRLGAAASAAVGLTNTVTWLINAPLWAAGTGVLAVVSREFGAHHTSEGHKAAIQSIWIALIFGAVLTCITQAVSPALPGWMGAEPSLRAPASAYFSIICLPLIFRALMIILGSTLRSVQDTRTPMRISLLVNILNILLNAVLIFPTHQLILPGFKISIPGAGLGVRGAAIATAVSFTAGGIAMFAAMWRNPAISPKGCPFTPNSVILRRCLLITGPAAATRIVSCLGHVVFSAQVTHLGTQALAAHTLALTAEEGFYIPGYGLQAAVSTLSGNAAGAGDTDALKGTCRSGLLIGTGIMCITGLILFLIPSQMMRLFTTDPGVIRDGAAVLRIVALSEPIFTAAIILEGVFDGIGDTTTPLIYSLISMWGVRIFLSHICISWFHLYLEAVWVCMVFGNITNMLLLAVRYRQGRWRSFVAH